MNCQNNLLNAVGLEKKSKEKTKAFSFGMKQRLGLAQALLNNPEFLILDEPFVGLDPIGKNIFKRILLEKAQDEKVGILFSSHDLEDVALEFFYSKAGGFITSDFPVSFGRDSGIKAENIQTAYFPISPKVAVLWGNYEDLKRRSNRVVEVNTESVIDFNKTFLKGNAGRYKYVFADCKEALEACIE